MSCEDSQIKERLEYLKNFAYDELNRLKIKIHGEVLCDSDSCCNAATGATADKNKASGVKKNRYGYDKHRKAFKRTSMRNIYRKFKK